MSVSEDSPQTIPDNDKQEKEEAEIKDEEQEKMLQGGEKIEETSDDENLKDREINGEKDAGQTEKKTGNEETHLAAEEKTEVRVEDDGIENQSKRKGGGGTVGPAIGLLQRLFRRRNKDEEEKKRDVEAATELLNKNNAEHPSSRKNGDIEIEVHNDGKQDGDKSDKTDTTAEVGGEKDGLGGRKSGEKPSYVERLTGIPKERLVIIGFVVVLLLLVGTIIIGILVTGNEPTQHKGRYVETMTHCGLVQGLVEDNAFVFRGIPYALPPIGERRWKPSDLAGTLEECWTDTYLAHNHSRLCYQKPLPHPYGDLQFSEDCLYLDVYTPRVTYKDPMSVVVYFAGDSFQGHDKMDFKWRPSAKLAREKQVVFVVVYYRMSAFGFLALELLTKNVHPPTSGNYGLHDMLTALKWVHRNIENFGGNSAKVTVLGHGSGATGILALMSSRLSQMLFTQAWIIGGSAQFVNKTLREVERNNEAFNRHLICDTTECLYSKTPEQILSAIPVSEWPFWGVPNHLELPTIDEHTAAIAVVDGTILYDNPSAVWEEENFVDVALVIGSSVDSIASGLIDDVFENFDWEQFNSTVKSRLNSFGSTVAGEAIERYYDGNSSAVDQYVRMVSDLRVTCPLFDLALRASKAFINNVYFYLASHVPDGIIQHMNFSNRMAVHGLDVAAIFGRIPEVLGHASESDMRFQQTVQTLFYHFVEHGRLSLTENPKMPWHLNWIYDELETTTDRYPNCDFWKRVGMYPKYARMN